MSTKTQVAKDKEDAKRARESRQTSTRYKSALKRIQQMEVEREALLAIKKNTSSFVISAKQSSKTSEACAVAVASDWHVEEEVKPEWVNNKNHYTLAIAKARATQFFQRIERLVRKEQQDVKINTLILALLGDFFSGNIHEELLETCALPPIEATMYAQELLVSGIEFLLAHTKLQLVIPCKVGNHSRITEKIHSAFESANSLEHMMYCNMAQRFKSEPRVKFVIETGYFTYLNVFDLKVRFHHGHAIRSAGGVGGLYPALLRAIYQWNIGEQADVTVCGHFHEYHPARRFVVNGCMIGYNPYAVRLRGEFQPPQQAFFLLDKKRGMTVQMPILFSV